MHFNRGDKDYGSQQILKASWTRTHLYAVTATLPLAAGDKQEVKGLITGRTGETLTLKTAEGTNVVVVLSDDTTVQQPKGLGLRKKQMSMAALLPGLRITVKGAPDAGNRFLADTITFSKDDLQTAEQIQAGLVPTQQNVAANQQGIQENKAGIASNKSQIASNKEQIGTNQQQIAANQQEIQDTNKRFSELSDYDTKGELNVLFAAGSTAISAKDKAALSDLAHKAVNLTGYIVQVKGFADSSGNAAMNQKLSMERAQNVIAYLIQTCNIPVRHVVAPGAMGEADPAATNETAQGRSENRRVEVKVLVNRGLAGN
jgi:outer membrane protein OmpA-like peptidoglycan-associated protein